MQEAALKNLIKKYSDVRMDDLRQLFNKGIQDYDLSSRTAGNILRAVLGAVYNAPEVFAKIEISEMKTTAAVEFYHMAAEQLQTGKKVYVILN